MTDLITHIGHGSLIQHGKHNDRIYLMKVHPGDTENILNELNRLTREHNYGKLFCKIPQQLAPLFAADGFTVEAIIPNFYEQKEDAFFMAKYPKPERSEPVNKEQLDELQQLLSGTNGSRKAKGLPDGYSIRRLGAEDAGEIAAIYRQVFASYPFPIFEPAYIRETMADNVFYFGAAYRGKLVALSSSEIDFKGQNAEMTDFSTLPAHLGKGLSLCLLETMEQEMKKQQIKTLYTIARLNSVPMNKTFLHFDYWYAGTLIQNTNIAGQLESMNVYYKHL
jgi:putative beta-lysine N-acetyltransferase